MSLMQKLEKIKYYYQILLTTLIFNAIILIVISSYLYDEYYNKDEISYVFEAFEVSSLYSKIKNREDVSLNNDLKGKIVASKSGTKYYYPNCQGINRIKIENRVYFDDFMSAEKAGYDLAKNCEKPKND